MKKSDCFAMNGLGRCSALCRTYCAESDKYKCSFYKTKEQAEKEKKNYERSNDGAKRRNPAKANSIGSEEAEQIRLDGVSTIEASRMTGLSTDSIINYVKEGKLKGVRCGRRWVISRGSVEELVKYLESGKAHKSAKGIEDIKPDDLYTTGDIARIPGITRSVVETWMSSGVLQYTVSQLKTKQIRGNDFIEFYKRKKKYEEEYLTIEQAAQLLTVSESTVWHMINDGRLGAERFGRRWYIPKTEIKDSGCTEQEGEG